MNKRESHKSPLFVLLFLILTGVLCFRYGQGTDYPAYEAAYYYLNAKGNLFHNALYHGEWGWYILMMVFKRLGYSFQFFVGCISLVMMIATFRAINAHSPFKSFSLALLYPTYYLTYYSSVLRQGLVLALFLDVGISLLKRKKYVPYYALVIILTLLHRSGLLLVALPLLLRLQKPRFYMPVFLSACLAPPLMKTSFFSRYLALLGAGVYSSVSFSYQAFALRLILTYFVIRMHQSIEGSSQNNRAQEDDEAFFYRIYLLGMEIYVALSPFALISQRMTAPLKIVEILLIPIQVGEILKLIGEKRRVGLLRVKFGPNKPPLIAISIIIILMINVEMVKNVNSYINQGGYRDDINVFNFPYVSIFNKDDAFKVRRF